MGHTAYFNFFFLKISRGQIPSSNRLGWPALHRLFRDMMTHYISNEFNSACNKVQLGLAFKMLTWKSQWIWYLSGHVNLFRNNLQSRSNWSLWSLFKIWSLLSFWPLWSLWSLWSFCLHNTTAWYVLYQLIVLYFFSFFSALCSMDIHLPSIICYPFMESRHAKALPLKKEKVSEEINKKKKRKKRNKYIYINIS